MRIVSHLPELMATKRIRNVNRLSEETGIGTPTLYRLFDGTNTRIDYETIIKLCSFFNCSVGDLLEFVPD